MYTLAKQGLYGTPHPNLISSAHEGFFSDTRLILFHPTLTFKLKLIMFNIDTQHPISARHSNYYFQVDPGHYEKFPDDT